MTGRAPTSRLRRGGLTLLELLAVVLLAAILASVVVVRFSGPQREANWRHTVDRLAFLDQQLRSRSRRFGGSRELVFDVASNRVELRAIGGQEETVGFTPPRGVKLDEVRLAKASGAAGRVTIVGNPLGVTPTYAVCFDTSQGSPRWLLVAGVTGQVHETKHENEIKNMLAFLATAGR